MLQSLTLAPTPDPLVFAAADGTRHSPPLGWVCLPPGDAGLTRRVKQAGPSWAVIEKRGRKAFSRGLWAPAEHITFARAALEAERAAPEYAKKLGAARAKRAATEVAYAAEFERELLTHLRFAAPWSALGSALAHAVAAHATPVGSGTVARTKRIGVSERAEAALIAWMRHQTTAYDHMQIARVKGERREVRRALAQISRALLELHQKPAPHAAAGCPLCRWRAPSA
jgi:hypothetical protein